MCLSRNDPDIWLELELQHCGKLTTTLLHFHRPGIIDKEHRIDNRKKTHNQIQIEEKIKNSDCSADLYSFSVVKILGHVIAMLKTNKISPITKKPRYVYRAHVLNLKMVGNQWPTYLHDKIPVTRIRALSINCN